MKQSFALVAAAATLLGFVAAAPLPQDLAGQRICVADMVEDSEGKVSLDVARCLCGNGGRACFDPNTFTPDFGGSIEENNRRTRITPLEPEGTDPVLQNPGTSNGNGLDSAPAEDTTGNGGDSAAADDVAPVETRPRPATNPGTTSTDQNSGTTDEDDFGGTIAENTARIGTTSTNSQGAGSTLQNSGTTNEDDFGGTIQENNARIGTTPTNSQGAGTTNEDDFGGTLNENNARLSSNPVPLDPGPGQERTDLQ